MASIDEAYQKYLDICELRDEEPIDYEEFAFTKRSAAIITGVYIVENGLGLGSQNCGIINEVIEAALPKVLKFIDGVSSVS